MANVWTQFKDLFPAKYQFIGKVKEIHLDGMSTVTMLDGIAEVRVVGVEVAVGHFALIEGIKILMEVPDLPTTTQAI